MYNKKNLFILTGFGFLAGFVLFTGLTTSKEELDNSRYKRLDIVEKSYFKEVSYYKLEKGKESVELQSEFLDITDNYLLKFKGPSGNISTEEKSYNYTAEQGVMNQKTKILNLSGGVRLSNKNSDYAFGELVYDGKKAIIYGKGNVAAQMVDQKTLDIIKIRAQELESRLNEEMLFMTGDVKGQLIRQRAYESGFKFSAEEMNLNSLESRMKLSKSVKLHRNNYYLQAENADIFLENFNKKLKYYELYDDVKLEEKLKLVGGKRQMRRAFAEKLEGHQRTGKIILTGAPRVEQGNDIIKGYQITLKENVELVEVDDSQSSFSLKRKK